MNTTGVAVGLLASLAVAFVLKQFFPASSSGAHREMLEGFVGIIAVVMIITIGAWLHSKSSLKSWQAYIKRHMGVALTTGSFISLFSLSFLSVFREGAEIILFYIGILPNISMYNFVLGIILAVVILVVIAVILLKGTVNLPIPTMFKILTWVLYILGFKILGMSVHSLGLTDYLPFHTISGLPNVTWLGFYATIETILAQMIYILAIWLLQRFIQSSENT